jgi:hypothetical protein
MQVFNELYTCKQFFGRTEKNIHSAEAQFTGNYVG